MATDPSPPISTAGHTLVFAFAVVCITMAGEYFFRHYVLFYLPVIGNLRVDDMLSLLLAYTLLLAAAGAATQTDWRHEFHSLAPAFKELTTKWGYTVWILLMVLSLSVLPFADRFLWRGIQIPMITSGYRSPIEWLVPQAPALKAIALIAVNGLFIPIAEEFLWRGIVQERLLRIWPKAAAIGVTAVLFSLKHVLVDASFGRFLTLIAFGVICGIVASRKSWHYSAGIHLLMNTIATVVGLVAGLE